ncbi:MAG: mevalonate kinase [Planctomycetota bacterium]|nr:MAG: mevalonate kinase [Planctomycetota bacterium]
MIGEACGKAILFGEHAVVHRVPAIAVPLVAVRLRVALEPAPQAPRPFTLLAEQGPPLDPAAESLVRRMVARALELAGRSEEPLRVRLRSTIPLGAGLGSSAALAVALVRAIAPGADAFVLARRANVLEEIAHGTPSGIDATCIAYERTVLFERGQRPRFLRPRVPLRLAVAVLPRRGTTASLVAGVRALQQAGDPRFTEFLATSRQLVESARQWFVEAGHAASGEPPPAGALGRLMDQAHAALAALGLSSPEQDGCCAVMRAAGALGAKLSGAGGGGATLALLPPDAGPALEERVLGAARGLGALDAFVTTIA